VAMPIEKAEVERVLRPWLGSLFLNAHPLADIITEKLSNYAPYRQDFKTLHDELEAHYHPHVDFAAVQRAGAALLDKLDNL